MMLTVYRERVRDAIVSALQPRQDIAGCWEGGAAATGRVDDFSDIDLVVVAPLDAADTIFAAIETAVAAVGEISHRWHVERYAFVADAGALRQLSSDLGEELMRQLEIS